MDLNTNRRFWARWRKFPMEVMIDAMYEIAIDGHTARIMMGKDILFVEERPHHRRGSVLFIMNGPYPGNYYVTHELIEEIK